MIWSSEIERGYNRQVRESGRSPRIRESSGAATGQTVKEMLGGWVKRGWGHYQTVCQE